MVRSARGSMIQDCTRAGIARQWNREGASHARLGDDHTGAEAMSVAIPPKFLHAEHAVKPGLRIRRCRPAQQAAAGSSETRRMKQSMADRLGRMQERLEEVNAARQPGRGQGLSDAATHKEHPRSARCSTLG